MWSWSGLSNLPRVASWDLHRTAGRAPRTLRVTGRAQLVAPVRSPLPDLPAAWNTRAFSAPPSAGVYGPCFRAAASLGVGFAASALMACSSPLRCEGGRRSDGGPGSAADVAYLQEELDRIADSANARVGICVTCIDEPSLRAGVNGQGRFPMASTFKVPLAILVLRLVDAGVIRLDDSVDVKLTDVRPGTGVVTSQLLKSGPSSFRIGKLLELAMTESDNTSTDLLLDMVGGPDAVTACLRELGVEDITVSRSCLGHLSDRVGVHRLPDRQDMVGFVAMLEERMEMPLSALREADAAFDRDPRDTATPDEMTRLLVMLWKRQVGLTEASTKELLSIMAACRTGLDRLPGRLPAHMQGKVMHKTGSVGGRANDVGFIALPNGRVLAISTYTMGGPVAGQTTTQEMYAQRGRAIADMARACYDFFQLRRA